MPRFIHTREPNPHFLPRVRPFRINALRTQFFATPLFPINYAFPPGVGPLHGCPTHQRIGRLLRSPTKTPVCKGLAISVTSHTPLATNHFPFNGLCNSSAPTPFVFIQLCNNRGWGVDMLLGGQIRGHFRRQSAWTTRHSSHVIRHFFLELASPLPGIYGETLPMHRDCVPIPKPRDVFWDARDPASNDPG